jgi:hypothetical protein
MDFVDAPEDADLEDAPLLHAADEVPADAAIPIVEGGLEDEVLKRMIAEAEALSD